jgi:hypothetical protein
VLVLNERRGTLSARAALSLCVLNVVFEENRSPTNMKFQPANGPRSAYSFGSGVTKQCVEAERLWTICLEAGIAYRDSEKMELISLMRRDPQFRSFEYDIEFARHYYTSAKSALAACGNSRKNM